MMMAKLSFLSPVAVLVALVLSGVDLSRADDHDHDHETCACAAEEYGFSIDCSNEDAMLAALPLLQSNDCVTDCTSDVCRRNYFIVQAHHDYCLESEVPETVEDALHIYEDNCEDCDIVRKPDPSLPDCPEPACSDGSGDAAYQELIAQGCTTNCTSSACVENYRILRSVHDSCEEDSLGEQAEFGIHELEEPCEEQSCNVGDTSFSQLVCVEEEKTSAAFSLGSFLTLFVAATALTSAII